MANFEAPRRATLFPAFLAIAGAMPLLTAHFWYKIGLMASAQVGTLRTLALFGVIALGFGAVALLGAAVATALGWSRAPERLRAGVRAVFYALAAGNLASVGLSLFYWSPMLAPLAWRLAALALLVALVAAFIRYRREEQVLVVRALTGFGLALIAVPALASPWVLVDAWRFGSFTPHAKAVPAGAELRPDAPKRVVLVTFDALPARATSMHNPRRNATPALAALSREATWYTNARSAGAWTLVSMPTVLTGLVPSTHQKLVDNRTGLLPRQVGTGLGGYLQAAGYRTLYSTMIIEPGFFGLRQEFDEGFYSIWALFAREFQSADYVPLRESWRYLTGTLLKRGQPTASASTDGVPADDNPLGVVRSFEKAQAMIEASPDKSFIWVHVGAPHVPYFDMPRRSGDEPPATAKSRRINESEVHAMNAAPDAAQAREVQAVFERYLEFVDGEFERFLAALKRSPHWDATMLVVTADHGESFEPGNIGHDAYTLLSDHHHVPLLIRTPGQKTAARVDAPVGHQDLVPTILGRVYDQPAAGLPGRDLLGRAVTEPRILFSAGRMSEQANKPLAIAAHEGAFTYVFDFENHKGQLFDHARDPLERTDVAARHPEVAARLNEAVQAEYARYF